MTLTCAYCGAVAAGESPPLTWSTSVEGSVLRRYCEQCSREHLRSIEGKLDPEWWS